MSVSFGFRIPAEDFVKNKDAYYAQLRKAGHDPRPDFDTTMGGLKRRVTCRSCKKDFSVKYNFVMDRQSTPIRKCEG